jgi:hypothetical protein
MALAVALAAVVILAAFVLALVWLFRTKPEQLGDDLTVRNLRPRGNVRRLGGDDE